MIVDVKSNCKKLLEIGPEKIAKIQNISKNELNPAKKLQKKSIDELNEIARLRKIKNTEKLTKEDLIIILLKSESSTAKQNFDKLFSIININNNNNNNDNNNNNNSNNSNNNTDDDTYDDKIGGKISDTNDT